LWRCRNVAPDSDNALIFWLGSDRLGGVALLDPNLMWFALWHSAIRSLATIRSISTNAVAPACP